ncbi:MAG: AraC family transcriptional regulator [Chloroflexota bacterium]
MKLGLPNLENIPSLSLKEQTIINGRNNAYYFHYLTPGLSIKTMSNGQAIYEIEGGRFAVSDDSYLILNRDQPYIIDITSPTIVESFCLFFPDDWVNEVAYTVPRPDDLLLDDMLSPTPVSFFERLYPHDDLVSPHIRRLHALVKSNHLTFGYLEEQLRFVLVAMLQQQFNIFRQIELLPAARPATRLELYRRLYRARDYIHASLHCPLTIADMAAVACLSPYHFLRAFKQVFNQTPHHYLTQKRLERARFLLTHTDHPVTDICFQVGFESLGSFSTLFRRYSGCSPRDYRKTAIFEK